MGINFKSQGRGTVGRGVSTSINRASWKVKGNSRCRKVLKRLTPRNIQFLQSLGIKTIVG